MTPSQLDQLHSLGLDSSAAPCPARSFLPLLSISGLTIFSLGGLILLKSSNSTLPNQPPSPKSSSSVQNTEPVEVPTQVPKSIQHYLLASQQYFSQALQMQNCRGESCTRPSPESNNVVNLLNQSILAASDAIKTFPNDYRGWQQRAVIYQNLIDSQPQLLNQAISDFQTAFKLNPSSAEVSRSLAAIYAKKGDAQNTLTYLSQTVILEPTKAQNFYDLAKLQQQVGLLPQALATYSQLLPLISDPNQLAQLKSEQSTLEKIIAQNPNSVRADSNIRPSPSSIITPTISLNSPTLQALASSTGLIIAAPETSKDIAVTNQTDSNSFSGSSVLPANTTGLTIANSHLTPTSKVYLTITKGNKDRSLTLTNKTTTDFTVALNSPSLTDTEFKWWIVN